MSTFSFKIVTPERVVFETAASQVTLPTPMGEITVLEHHIPLVSQLVPGEVIVKDEQGKSQSLAVSGGFVQVHPHELVILADTAEMAHEISEQRAVEAHQRAKELLDATTGMSDTTYAQLKVMMDKELARLKVARKTKHHEAMSIKRLDE